MQKRITRLMPALLALAFGLSACGGFDSLGAGKRNAKTGYASAAGDYPNDITPTSEAIGVVSGRKGESSIFNVLQNNDDPNTTVEVNKYIWRASLEVLDFLPVETVDPFSGVISTGYGTPPGGSRAYRATVYVQDPALDARSLKVALQGRGGSAVSPETTRAVEDAILTRARQLRIADSKF